MAVWPSSIGVTPSTLACSHSHEQNFPALEPRPVLPLSAVATGLVAREPSGLLPLGCHPPDESPAHPPTVLSGGTRPTTLSSDDAGHSPPLWVCHRHLLLPPPHGPL